MSVTSLLMRPTTVLTPASVLLYLNGEIFPFVDTSPQGNSISNNGGVTQSTVWSSNGSASMLFSNGVLSDAVASHYDGTVTSGVYTFSADIRLTGYPAAAGATYISYLAYKGASGGNTNLSYVFYLEGTASGYTYLTLGVFCGGTLFLNTRYSNPFTLNTMYTVGFTINKLTSVLKIQVNGVDVATGSFSGTINRSVGGLYLGGSGGMQPYPYYFKGYMDNVTITQT
jgi:Concanavalin A-like lectin/glucanases superfamily